VARTAPPIGSASRTTKARIAPRRMTEAYFGGGRSALPRRIAWLAAVLRDVRPGPVVARVRRVAGVGLDHDDLQRVAGVRASGLLDRRRDEHAHVARDAPDRRRAVATRGRPRVAARRRLRRGPGEALELARRDTAAEVVQERPVRAPPGQAGGRPGGGDA